jgi:uncharacterized repeat protein (TIGR02543 family)
MKRTYLFVLVASLLLSGCTQNNGGNTPVDGGGQTDQPSTSIDDGYRTVTFDTKGGSKIDSQRVLLGEKITKPSDPTKEGHSFTTWTYDLEPWDFDEGVVTSDMTLEAQYTANQYELLLAHYNGENHGTITGNGTYTYGSSVILNAVPDTGYIFAGWYKNEYKLLSTEPTYVYTMGLDQTLYARWDVRLNNLSVTSENESEGTVRIVNGNGYTGESITIQATPADGYSFVGWYNQSAELSTEPLYTFSMPGTDYAIVAKFISNEVLLKQELGLLPVIANDHKTMTYGTYPQHLVEDETLIMHLDSLGEPEENGWYKYEGYYYCKLEQSKWYKCGRVTWTITSYSGSTYNVYCNSCFYYCKYSQRTEALQHIYENVFKLDSSCIEGSSNVSFYTLEKIKSLSDEQRKCEISQYTKAKYGGSAYWGGYTVDSGMNVAGQSWKYYDYNTITASSGAIKKSGGTSTTPENYSSKALNRPAAIFTIVN